MVYNSLDTSKPSLQIAMTTIPGQARRGSILMPLLFLGASLVAGACNQSATRMNIPAIETRADSLAMAVLDANGGRDAWESLRYLKFTFGSEQAGNRREFARHLWDRATGRYRVEWPHGDSLIVAAFDVESRDGEVYVDGVPADTSSREELLEAGYRRYINDTYWLMSPVKMLDPGVTRRYLPDSSNAEHEVVQLTFQDVGLTPGDTYWMYIDTQTDLVSQWAMVLQGNPNASPNFWNLREYRDFQVPAGTVRFATRKETPDGSFAMVTDQIETPSVVPDSMFTSPHPVL